MMMYAYTFKVNLKVNGYKGKNFIFVVASHINWCHLIREQILIFKSRLHL